MVKRTGSTNPILAGLILQLKKRATEKNEKIWHRIAEDLETSARMRSAVNLYKIIRSLKENETAIVPGKVLGTGDITHKISVAAYSFSDSAKEKILKSKGEAMSIADLLQKNPKPQNLRIIG